MVSDLFYDRELGVLVEVVPGERKMVVKRSPGGLIDVVAVSIDPQIRRRLALPNVLGLSA